MKQKLEILRSRSFRLASAGVVLVGASGAAHAELPAPVAAAFTTLTDNFTAMELLAWPVLATITGGFILMKLFKKSANKAT